MATRCNRSLGPSASGRSRRAPRIRSRLTQMSPRPRTSPLSSNSHPGEGDARCARPLCHPSTRRIIFPPGVILSHTRSPPRRRLLGVPPLGARPASHLSLASRTAHGRVAYAKVLSVIAQQLLVLREGRLAAKSDINFMGVQIALKDHHVIITMNPGYAGRTELPDNLAVSARRMACSSGRARHGPWGSCGGLERCASTRRGAPPERGLRMTAASIAVQRVCHKGF